MHECCCKHKQYCIHILPIRQASAPSIRRNCSSIPQLILSSITYVCWSLKHEIIESYVAVEYCFGLTWPLKKSLIFIETFYVWSFNLSLCSLQTAFAANSTHMTYFWVNLDGQQDHCKIIIRQDLIGSIKNWLDCDKWTLFSKMSPLFGRSSEVYLWEHLDIQNPNCSG